MTIRGAVLGASAYVPDWAGLDRSAYLRLDRNEGTRPVPPSVVAALTHHIAGAGVHTYPDAERLADPIGAYCGLPADCVLPTNGSDQAIDLTLRAYLGPGRRMLVARPEFAVFGHVAGLAEATVDGVPYTPDLSFPYTGFRTALRSRPDLVVFINPNNPTGTPVDLSFVEETLRSYPSTPVIVDEAYHEFTGVTAVPMIERYPNLVVLRTFSKAFAMAGLRLGYALAQPATIAELTKLRNPFDVNSLAIVAASAHLGDLAPMRAFVEDTMTVVKPRVVEYFGDAGERIWPGAANFVLVRPAGGAAAAVEHLRGEGILVRPMGHPALSGTFRMSLGSAEEMAMVFAAYDRHLRDA